MNETNNHKARLIFLHALTPMHVGTGQAVANVDLPIAREKATGFPIVPASAFKGVLRDYFAYNNTLSHEELIKAFGSEPPKPGETEREPEGGDWAFTDLRILCLPVRSFYGTFAYVTCPLVLQRLKQAAQAFRAETPYATVPSVEETQVLTATKGALFRESKVYLEELDLGAREDEQAQQIAQALAERLFGENGDERQAFVNRFAIVSDQVFDYLSETATEIAARVRLEDDKKTVAGGALWYEEFVPAESIFYGFATHAKARGHQMPFKGLEGELLVQIGGDATIGRGICRVVIR